MLDSPVMVVALAQSLESATKAQFKKILTFVKAVKQPNLTHIHSSKSDTQIKDQTPYSQSLTTRTRKSIHNTFSNAKDCSKTGSKTSSAKLRKLNNNSSSK